MGMTGTGTTFSPIGNALQLCSGGSPYCATLAASAHGELLLCHAARRPRLHSCCLFATLP